jgi:hypothetical protein
MQPSAAGFYAQTGRWVGAIASRIPGGHHALLRRQMAEGFRRKPGQPPKATPRPPQSDPKATSKPPTSQLQATCLEGACEILHTAKIPTRWIAAQGTAFRRACRLRSFLRVPVGGLLGHPTRGTKSERLPGQRAHLDNAAGRGGPKSEIRNPKPETNSNAQCSKAKNRPQCSSFGHSLLGAWGLFRASSFGFRVSALWMAVVPRCTPGQSLAKSGVDGAARFATNHSSV